MAGFEQLQELWREQASAAVPPAAVAALTRSLAAYGRRQRLILGGKLVLITAILGSSMYQVRDSLPAIAGLLLTSVVAGIMVAVDWRNQRSVAGLDFTAASLGFVHNAIDRLRLQRNPYRGFYWPLLGSLVVSMNLVLGSSHRLPVRLIASALPFGAYEVGMWVRRKRFEAECRPLLNQLIAMKNDLEERSL